MDFMGVSLGAPFFVGEGAECLGQAKHNGWWECGLGRWVILVNKAWFSSGLWICGSCCFKTYFAMDL